MNCPIHCKQVSEHWGIYFQFTKSRKWLFHVTASGTRTYHIRGNAVTGSSDAISRRNRLEYDRVRSVHVVRRSR